MEEVSKLCHARLGHVNYQEMSLMAKEKMVKGFSNITQPKDVCVGILLSKQTRKQMPTKSTFSAAKVLELVHDDLCGPIMPETTVGNRLYCERSGIRRHYIAPYTPQQNDMVECRNSTVMEMARNLLKEMNLPATFWGEAVPSHFTSKLDDRSVCVVNLGKEPGSKAYELYNPKEKRIHVSRDVIFEEKKAWPWKKTEICEDEQMNTFVIDDMLMNDGEGGEENQDAENETQHGSPVSPSTTQDLRAENYNDSVTPK
ncbi:hypothetical protein AgCh_001244 [Apium graveolens]